MTLYLDTSVIVPLFIDEPWSERAEALFISRSSLHAISDLSEVEFASAVSRRVRAGDIASEAGHAAVADFDAWIIHAQRAVLSAADLAVAKSYLRRFNLPLRTGDAMHIAVAQRIGATLATFDRQMADSAARLGVPVVTE